MNIGIDAVLITRIEKSLKTPSFGKRVFGEEERCELEKCGFAPKSAAAAFAAKEAFGKAMGTGILTAFALNEVQLLHSENGAPYLKLSGNAAKLAKGKTTAVSLTHEAGLAIAVVLLHNF